MEFGYSTETTSTGTATGTAGDTATAGTGALTLCSETGKPAEAARTGSTTTAPGNATATCTGTLTRLEPAGPEASTREVKGVLKIDVDPDAVRREVSLVGLHVVGDEMQFPSIRIGDGSICRGLWAVKACPVFIVDPL